ncbi:MULTISPECIES: CBS domain-containing protein [Dyella]|uniref:CBS domain-containing protein n=2 Tax=Dyella TaxID=231454 RepID=A0A4R0YWJ2_9GAMM|nr:MULTISPECIES: CBS domain-containing protein [Dyella]TBR39494.1 CBS domain-containing protein [Dyella terrae]TCI12921.1 CBS domain-containing protein [Dyella soli]
MHARDIMTAHPRCCGADDTLEHAARLMAEEDVGEIPVIDAAHHVVGVITDRDIVLRCVAQGESATLGPVGKYMTAPALCLGEDASLEDVAHLMASQRIRRVPITDGEQLLCGIVALADLEKTDARSLKMKVAERVSAPH